MISIVAVLTSVDAKRFWLFVIGIGLALRVAAVIAYGEFEQPLLYEYGGIARHLIAGQGYSTVFPELHPGYGSLPITYPDATPTALSLPVLTLIVAGVLAIFGETTTSYVLLYVLNLLASLLAVYLIGIIARELYGESVGRWAAVLAAIYPTIVITPATMGGTAWFHAIMVLTVLLVIRAARNDANLRLIIFAGISAGVWVLFRSEGFAATVLLALWLWHRTSFKRALVFGMFAILVFSPWSIRNTLVFDTFVPFSTNFWLNAWRGNNVGSIGGAFYASGSSNWSNEAIREELSALPAEVERELRIMEVYKGYTLDFISSNPGRAALRYFKKLGMFLSIDYSDPRARAPMFFLPHVTLTLGALCGCFILFRRRAILWPIASIIASNALIVSALHVGTRYQLILAPLYIVCFAVLLDMLHRHIVLRRTNDHISIAKSPTE